jgi:biotin carboxyl carrier protein
MNEYVIRLNSKKKNLKILNDDTIEVDGREIKFFITETTDSKYFLKIDNKIFEASMLDMKEEDYNIFIDNQNIEVNIKTSLQEKAFQLLSEAQISSNHQTTIKSPMPGLVVKILKNPGDKIFKGEAVMILEAMKMENEIKASIDGIISEIFVDQDKAIEKNIPLFTIK